MEVPLACTSASSPAHIGAWEPVPWAGVAELWLEAAVEVQKRLVEAMQLLL